MSTPTTIDQYIATLPQTAKPIVERIRSLVHECVPQATEVISYGIPTFRLDGKNLVHFAGYERHIGLYATPDGQAEFEADLSRYKRGKGSVQFLIDKPIPYDLIKRIVKYRAAAIMKESK